MITAPHHTASFPSSSYATIGLFALFLVTGQLLCGQTPTGQKLPPPVASMEPGDLLKLMPAAPKNWKVTASHATNELASELGTRTFAIRDYLYIPPPDPAVAGTPPPSPPQKTRLTLLDTGYDPSTLSEFVKFKPGTTYPAETATRRYMIGEHPAVLKQIGTGKLMLTVNLASRFNIVVELENQADAALQQWLDLLNLPALTAEAAEAPHRPIPAHTVHLTAIDELNPKMNRSYVDSYSTDAEEAAVEKAEAAKTSMLGGNKPQ